MFSIEEDEGWGVLLLPKIRISEKRRGCFLEPMLEDEDEDEDDEVEDVVEEGDKGKVREQRVVLVVEDLWVIDSFSLKRRKRERES